MNNPHCDQCEYEWSACLGDDEIPDTCECGGNVTMESDDEQSTSSRA